jgi:alpha-galactosidase/6-phospho-beta-glucosidase family protein
MPSGEMVAGVIDSLITGRMRVLPLNIPNRGQVADLPHAVVTESMCIADGDGVRGGAPVSAPPALAEALRRVSASQELTVDAGLTGDRDKAFGAMFLDPLAGRIDFERLGAMTDEMLAATKPWLPQFA